MCSIHGDAQMTTTKLSRSITAVTLCFVAAGVALGQAPQVFQIPRAPQTSSWGDGVQRKVAAKEKVYVVTIAHPKHRNTCIVQSVDADEIVCTHPGHKTIFRAGDVAALIKPGEHTPVLLLFVSFLAGTGAATWGTVVLAGVCPVCAVATGITAAVLFILADGSGFLADGDYADSLLYLAAGQRLQVRLN